MKAHVFALCLSLSLCLGLPLPALAFASPFTDVQETSPYYEKYVIPEGTYDGVPEATTVAVSAVIIARDDVSDADVYNIVSTIFENKDSLAHNKAKELDLEFAAGVTNVPYHPGAAKYFAEKGFEVPTK